MLWWRQRHRRPQWRHSSVARDSGGSGRRLTISSSRLIAGLVAIFLMSAYMIWNESTVIQLREHEDSVRREDYYIWSHPSNHSGMGISNGNSTHTVRSSPKLVVSTGEGEIDNHQITLSERWISPSNIVDPTYKVPETRNHLNSLSAYNFDGESLKNAYVYRPGKTS